MNVVDRIDRSVAVDIVGRWEDVLVPRRETEKMAEMGGSVGEEDALVPTKWDSRSPPPSYRRTELVTWRLEAAESGKQRRSSRL